MENKSPLLITLIIVVLLFFGLVVLFYYTISQNTLLKEKILLINQQQTDSTDILSAKIEELKNQLSANDSTNNTPDSNAGITYLNNDFGFSLQLPAGWEGYMVTKSASTATSINTTIFFGLKNWPEIFAIGIYTKEQWNKIGDDELAKRSYLAENSKYVFTSARAQDFGPPEYNNLVNNYDEIIKTFKVFNK
ncbi:MAG: hypothetical protein Q7K65_03310 [Candidatus Buchananbacteria bacterium]|nr:hypothetical protein [Candidatus Buchananbacteria bacterium]